MSLGRSQKRSPDPVALRAPENLSSRLSVRSEGRWESSGSINWPQGLTACLFFGFLCMGFFGTGEFSPEVLNN